MNEENKYIEEQEEESSIDFGKIFRDLLKHKKLYYKVLPITFVIAAFIALSIPNYYQAGEAQVPCHPWPVASALTSLVPWVMRLKPSSLHSIQI